MMGEPCTWRTRATTRFERERHLVVMQSTQPTFSSLPPVARPTWLLLQATAAIGPPAARACLPASTRQVELVPALSLSQLSQTRSSERGHAQTSLPVVSSL